MLIIGNWKMSQLQSDVDEFCEEFVHFMEGSEPEPKKENLPDIGIAPSFVHIQQVQNYLRNTPVKIIAQNVDFHEKGAFTGEISAQMLNDIGTKMVLIGHSERRNVYHETNEILAQKINCTLRENMQIVFCVGEKLDARQNQKHFEVIASQISSCLFHLSEKNWANIILAYEPVWAIGTGQIPSPQEINSMHLFIRELIAQQYSESLASTIQILYGGSVNSENARQIFEQPNVDGGLLGNASLKASDFIKIIQEARREF